MTHRPTYFPFFLAAAASAAVLLGAGCAANGPGYANHGGGHDDNNDYGVSYYRGERGPVYYGGGYFGENYPGQRYVDGPPIHPELAAAANASRRQDDRGY